MKFQICWLFAVAATAQAATPWSVQWSDQTYGPDGPWHAVSVQLGSNKQPVDLYPGSRWVSQILTTSVCSNASTVCYAKRGGLYNISDSDTGFPLSTPTNTSELPWQSDLASTGVNVWGGPGHIKQGALADTLRLPGGPAVPNVSMMAIYDAYQTYNGKNYPVTLGTLALGGTKRTHVVANTALNMLAAWEYWNDTSSRQIPSYSWGMHIGAVEPEIPGSLVLGGYDQSRVLNQVSSQQVDPKKNLGNLKIYLEDIGIGVATGDSPFGFQSKSGLFKWGDSTASASTRGRSVEIIPLLPYIYLPKTTCDAMAANLPVTFDEDLNLYLWNTEDKDYQNITSSPAYISFTFEMNSSNSQNLTVKVPFPLLKLTLQEPLVDRNMSYFPCYPSDSYILGRAFLQAAFVGVNWQDGTGAGKWFLAQAPGPAIGTGNQLSIAVDADSIEPSKNSWEASWDGYWVPLGDLTTGNSTTGNSKSDSTISTGAKAGIGIGCAVGGLGLIGALAWLFIHRKRAAKAKAAGVNQHKVPPTFADGTQTTQTTELCGLQLNELQADKGAQEAPGSTTLRHELS
ncbi:unnamed protein product [Penicillium salamii]|uniref:Peptidase A1 domain-containing protein n=1 Tax=Penicillium salamii TaxID=1612424 RepID=A0A9W4NXQ6_9EURO|nr:unnamed protein product [Penicillium salamii]CAG8333676.1 unnamed protein product [Penicillium salamii]CAG8360143.1 unnamed protein product [Penicillium salamii]CAG8371727.1 unnamed protein product [Penicillium salamii]CAG8386428.1 unnamed protein product [Penicillium salamii]